MGLVEIRIIASKKDIETMLYGMDRKKDKISRYYPARGGSGDRFRVYIEHNEPD